jgi:hypothetical protein
MAVDLRLTAQRKPAWAAFFRERRFRSTIFGRSIGRRFSIAIEFTRHGQYSHFSADAISG